MSGFSYVSGDVPYFKSDLLSEYGIKHAFFTKHGGVSENEFSSLNFAVGLGDKKDTEENVFNNHKIAASVFGLTENDICRTYQTHTDNIVFVTESLRGTGVTKPPFAEGVDGLVTRENNLLLSVRSADCVPVLLCDKNKNICAACHSGWRGTLKEITAKAVDIMSREGTDKNNILAAVGPCIGKCCFEVGFDVYNEFISDDAGFKKFFDPVGEKFMFDLASANVYVLLKAGIPENNISSCEICTKCHGDLFFSHRRQGAVRGTMGAFICI